VLDRLDEMVPIEPAPNRRTILAASMLGVRGRVQREGEVIHLIVEYLIDMSADLKKVSGLDTPFPLVAGRGDEAAHGGHGSDSRDQKALQVQPRDIYIPDLRIETLKVKASNFRQMLQPLRTNDRPHAEMNSTGFDIPLQSCRVLTTPFRIVDQANQGLHAWHGSIPIGVDNEFVCHLLLPKV
jgi:hypothetical protein